jgi:hypothetical protein
VHAVFRLPGTRAVAALAVVLALVLVPAPLLPPHRLAEVLQPVVGGKWSAAYLVAALGLQALFYSSLGLLSAFAVRRAPTARGRLLQIVLLPLAVFFVALLIRSLKLGHLPVLVNVLAPMAGCSLGVALGLGLLYRRVTLALGITVTAAVASLWGFRGGSTSELSRDVKDRLQQLVAAGPTLPAGDERFGALVRAAFAGAPNESAAGTALEQNRAAIVALGIAVGHERLARYAGLNPQAEMVRTAAALRQGATLRAREDWSRHFALSAALAVMEHPVISDAAGLMKEQLDALTHGSGFSFGDLAADRAGVRFATAATRSEAGARRMQARLQNGFAVDDFFPRAADLPENLTVDQFRAAYGGVGTRRYREQVTEIELRLDRCAGLASGD